MSRHSQHNIAWFWFSISLKSFFSNSHKTVYEDKCYTEWALKRFNLFFFPSRARLHYQREIFFTAASWFHMVSFHGIFHRHGWKMKNDSSSEKVVFFVGLKIHKDRNESEREPSDARKILLANASSLIGESRLYRRQNEREKSFHVSSNSFLLNHGPLRKFLNRKLQLWTSSV